MEQLNRIMRSSVVVGTSLGLAITITDVYNILGIVVLLFQIGIIIAQVAMRIKDSFKKGNDEDIKKALEDGLTDLKKLQEKHKDEQDT